MAKLTQSQERELRDAFNLFDRDHSGKITKSELRRMLGALNVKATDNEVQKLLRRMDTDNSGEIDFNEFKNAMAKSFFKKYSRKELTDAFKKFDIDGNGFISSKELENIMSRMGKHLSQKELQATISSLDLNKDGKISFDEFCTLFD
ncbi:unnamed protein product [Rotaria magnacalcarata]|uniref:EF-hand domain-containing protein n=1 Tax=Rotaria magnacalcarata TaxID=392030 RepID=A0A816LK44_9BILA|nr:unnamed protein product [Rotaria magnacalcarata]CAF1583866.1 unnamed protein product [Rotaria magnacalcarata]CAF1941786.1 unnamed protein product [Rotaria magnacalcarata]CAF2202195.1 unnamed protein product [Rotaria magnacalcarata]CAF2250997.1 unnamed protein product [Rotaria magnacalcarata]